MSKTDLNIDTEEEKKEILKRYRGLLRLAKKSKSKKDRAEIRKAFEIAVEAHRDMRRKSGEPFIYHPLEVAKIVAGDMGLGTTSIICALLHDTVEDTYITLDDVERIFGPKVSKIINGLTKIEGAIDNTPSMQAENFRKIILALSDDVRVILVKLADRLHNMRTLGSMSREKQLKIASETLFLYSPMAHRLGLYDIKTELEDIALKFQEPELYKEIDLKLKKTQAVRTRFINRFTLPIKRSLDTTGFKYEIKGRPKSVFSIANKMKTKGIPFEEVYDLFAIRIIIDSDLDHEKSDCWRVYSIVTDHYLPSPDRLRDWISTPKANGYESLHTTVMSPTGKWVEVQIRSERMNEIAEKGYAAHWKYKDDSKENSFDEWIRNAREMLESASNESVLDFVGDFKLNLYSQEIFVFTPKGEVISLPRGSSALDFAYNIHSQIGTHCIGAKVNNKLVAISHILKSGDQIEILTSKKQSPKEDWLGLVITAKARSRIKYALKEKQKETANNGREKLRKKLKKLNIDYTTYNLDRIKEFFGATSEHQLMVDIEEGIVNLDLLKKIAVEKGKLNIKKSNSLLRKGFGRILGKKEKQEERLVIGDGLQQIEYSFAKCCSPIAGDEVFGFVTVSEGIKIHKTNCPNAVQLLSHYDYRIVKAKWTKQQELAFLAGIQIDGIDDVGLVNRLTQIISSEENVNMQSINLNSENGIFKGSLSLYVQNTDHLNNLMAKIKKVEGIVHVKRMNIDPGTK